MIPLATGSSPEVLFLFLRHFAIHPFFLFSRRSPDSVFRWQCQPIIIIPLIWAEVQEHLGRSGVELRKRGAGLVFGHRTEKLFAKASAVGREFSLKKMEARLGSFEPAREGKGSADPDKAYRPKPRSSANLRHRYWEEMSQRKAMREERRLAAMASWRDRRRKLTEFRKSTRSRLFGLLRGKCGIEERVRHRAALVLTDRQVAEQREKLRDEYRREVGDARRHWSWQGWVEWLREQAARGDAEAIKAPLVAISRPDGAQRYGENNALDAAIARR